MQNYMNTWITVKKVSAQVDAIIGTPPANIPGYVKPSDAGARIAAFLDLTFIVAAIIATFFAIKGGFDFVMSSGEPPKIKAAQSTIQYAIIGLVVCACGFIIIRIVASTLGYNSSALDLPF
ncbi:hypothetical protein IT418_01150 [bacterium]|nr:hypothetical protein [bacterium]